jgi:hypothetical protein
MDPMSPMPDACTVRIGRGPPSCWDPIGHRTHRGHQLDDLAAAPTITPMGPMAGAVDNRPALASRMVVMGIGVIGVMPREISLTLALLTQALNRSSGLAQYGTVVP